MNLESAQLFTLPHKDIGRRIQGEAIPRERLRLTLYAGTLAADAAILLASMVLANLVHDGAPLDPAGLNLMIVLTPVYLVAGLLQHNYCHVLLRDWRESATRALSCLMAATAAVLFTAFYLRASTSISRDVSAVGILIAAVLLVASRYALKAMTSHVPPGRLHSELLIRDGVEAPAVPGDATIDAQLLGIRPDMSDPHMLHRLGCLLRRVDRVVVACAPERRHDWAMVLKGSNVRGVLLVPEIADLASIGAGRHGTASTLIVSNGPLDLRRRALKRLLDMAVALGALIALAPLLLATALAIRLDSPGPVFFVQPRLGRGNRLFGIYKFRSMKVESCDRSGALSTLRGDSRITRVGRFIRATSIDELPQLLNVLKGEMSIVGPRPHALGSLAGDKLFWEVDQRYWHRHAAKPGITGLAQVQGLRGATNLPSDLSNRLRADLDYLNDWTIWRDIAIMASTLKVVLHDKAY